MDYTFDGVTLRPKATRDLRRKLIFVTSQCRLVEVTKTEIVQSLINFLNKQLSIEKETSDQPFAELLYAPEALRTGNADLNGILAAHIHVVPDIPKRQSRTCARIARHECILMNLLKVSKVTAANDNNGYLPITY